eukprot:scaffold115924_cov18-Prasinocladus_malaysianus.AAC.1
MDKRQNWYEYSWYGTTPPGGSYSYSYSYPYEYRNVISVAHDTARFTNTNAKRIPHGSRPLLCAGAVGGVTACEINSSGLQRFDSCYFCARSTHTHHNRRPLAESYLPRKNASI